MGITKIVMLGGGGVGKSCLTIQLCHHYFTVEYDPTIENSYRTQMLIDDEVCMLDILDTAGQEEYIAMRDQYIQRGEGFALVFSILSKESLYDLEALYENILRVKDEDSFPVVLIGNKCDLSKDRRVLESEVKAFAAKLRCPYVETSAKTRYNVEDAFAQLVREIRKYVVSKGTTTSEDGKKKKKHSTCLII